MDFFKKTIEIRFRLRSLLIVLLCLGLLVAGVAMYQGYVFHNLFFSCLNFDAIASVQVCHPDGETFSDLNDSQTKELAFLLRNIRLRSEPYQDFGILGDKGIDYRISLKNGIVFDLNIYCGEPACYIINGLAYPAEASDHHNLLLLEALYNSHID